MPKVSVILTSYNHAKYIHEAIDSILYQTYNDFELIIWDDASTDDSWAIINSYNDSRIRPFRNEKNQRYTINSALNEAATGEYIAIIHSDDIWEPEKLEKQVAFLDSNSKVGAVFTNTSTIGEDSNPLTNKDHFLANVFNQPNRSRYQWLNYFFYNCNALCHPSVLIRRKCYDDCGLYRHGLAQLPDLDMWIRLCLQYEIHVLEDKLVRFRVRNAEANTSGNRLDTRNRHNTEIYLILNQYLNLKEVSEFSKAFPEAGNYLKDKQFDVKFAFAMLCIKNGPHEYQKLFGLQLLFNLMTDEESSNRIKNCYGFNYLDFIYLNGKYDIFNHEAVKSNTYLANRLGVKVTQHLLNIKNSVIKSFKL